MSICSLSLVQLMLILSYRVQEGLRVPTGSERGDSDG